MTAWWWANGWVSWSVRPDLWGPGLEVWVTVGPNDQRRAARGQGPRWLADWTMYSKVKSTWEPRTGLGDPGVAESLVLSGRIGVSTWEPSREGLALGQARAWTLAPELAAEFDSDQVSHPR